MTYIKENIITKLQKLYSLPRNSRAGSKLPMLFVKKPLCRGSLLPACKILIERPEHANEDSFFLRPTSSDEITNLILSLNESKSVGPNGLPTKILKLLKNDISLQLTNIFNLFFHKSLSFWT